MAYKVYKDLPKTSVSHALFDADQTLYPQSLQFEKYFLDNVLKKVAHEAFKKHGKDDVTEVHIEEKFTQYYRQYGVGLVGVAKELDIEASSLFNLAFNPDRIDYSGLPKCFKTREELTRLRDENKIRLAILSNSTDLHVHQVIAAMGLDGLFGLIHGINHNNFITKSDPNAFKNTLWEMAVPPEKVILFEDSLKNLSVARDLGFGYNVFIGESEKETPSNTENVFDLWAKTLPEALSLVNEMLSE